MVNVFQDKTETCVAYNQSGCTNYTANTFENLNYALWVEDASAIGPIDVRYNDFVNNNIGIFAKGAPNIFIVKNRFEIPDIFPGCGVYVNGAQPLLLQENRFEMPDVANTHFGAYIYRTGDAAAELYKNTFTGGNKNFAMTADGRNRQLTFKCNDVQDEMDNILVLSLLNAISGPNEQPEIFEFQGRCSTAPDDPANNKFAPDCDATYTHIWVEQNTRIFKYAYKDVTREEPLAACVNDLSIVIKDDCGPISTVDACDSRIDDVGGGITGGSGKTSVLKAAINQLFSNFDHGDTDGLLAMTNDMQTADSIVLDTLFAANGWLSDEVLFAATLRDPKPDSAKLASLLIQNAPHTQWVFSRIEALKTYLPEDSVVLLKQLQDSASARLDSMSLIHIYSHQRATTFNEMLYFARLDTNLSVQDIIDSIEGVRDYRLKMLLTELYMQTGKYGKADTVVAEIPEYDEEAKQYKMLMNILLKTLGDEYYLDTIGGSGYNYLDNLLNIAATNTAAGSRAQVILSIVSDSIYLPQFAEKEGSSSKMYILEQLEVTNEKNELNVTIDYKVHPTIINGETYGWILLGKDESGMLKIYSLQGASQFEIVLKEGVNYIPLNNIRQKGILIYRVWVNGEIKRNDKLIKIQ